MNFWKISSWQTRSSNLKILTITYTKLLGFNYLSKKLEIFFAILLKIEVFWKTMLATFEKANISQPFLDKELWEQYKYFLFSILLLVLIHALLIKNFEKKPKEKWHCSKFPKHWFNHCFKDIVHMSNHGHWSLWLENFLWIQWLWYFWILLQNLWVQ